MKKSIFTKLSLTLTLMVMLSTLAIAQDEKPSPPKTAQGVVNGAQITINYSSPAVKGRTIWGGLVPMGQVWRAGANEATTFETSKDIKVQGQDLKAGTYGFFVIPNDNEFTFIFNKNPKQWGAFKYDDTQDVLRVDVPREKNSSSEERLAYEVTADGFEIRWENAKAAAKIE